MTHHDSPHPAHYSNAIRKLIRYALVLLVIGLLSGVAYQESVKKLEYRPVPDGPPHWDVALKLALVHGHILTLGVLIPVAMAGMLHLARSHGGRSLSPRAVKLAVGTYLTFVSLTLALMLYKGYHILLSARFGESNLSQIDATFFGGMTILRHGVYGLSHVGMSFGLFVFAWCLWRSFKRESSGRQLASGG